MMNEMDSNNGKYMLCNTMEKTLMKLQSDNIGRACIKEEGVQNYLSVDQ